MASIREEDDAIMEPKAFDSTMALSSMIASWLTPKVGAIIKLMAGKKTTKTYYPHHLIIKLLPAKLWQVHLTLGTKGLTRSSFTTTSIGVIGSNKRASV